MVDTSGYSSQAPKWLKALSYEAPEETVMTTGMGYASRLYEIPAGFQSDWKGVYLQVNRLFKKLLFRPKWRNFL